MKFSAISISMQLLCLHYVIFWQLNESSGNHLSTKNKILSNESISEKFFVRFIEAYIKTNQLQYFTILGASKNELIKAKPFLESYPHFVYAETKENVYSLAHEFDSRNFVLVFLNDTTKEIFEKKIEFLSHCSTCKILFILERIIRIHDIWLLFNLTGKQNIGYVQFAMIEQNSVKLYGQFLADNCSMEVRLIVVWEPENKLDAIQTWTFRGRDLKGCPVSVSTSDFKPKMMIQQWENGSQTIAGGREGELILTIAKKLNFTVSLKYPSVSDRMKYSRKTSIVNNVISGTAEIGIGRLRPTNHLGKFVVFSVSYDNECITWGVPRLMGWSTNILSVEFTPRVWTLVILTFIISLVTGYSSQKIYYRRKAGNRTKIGFVAILLDSILIHLGNPVFHVPETIGGKLMLIAFLYYATVITTAYKTSLASILTTEEGTPKIVDVDGIIRANLSIGGSFYDFGVLRDQVNESAVAPELIKRFVINNNELETLERLKSNNDFAFLARSSSLHEERSQSVKANGSTNFDVIDDCVLTYRPVLIVRKDSYLQDLINQVIQRLKEAGILNHWENDKIDDDKILKRRSYEMFFEKPAGYKFKSIFDLYCGCIFLCVLTFLVELLISRFI